MTALMEPQTDALPGRPGKALDAVWERLTPTQRAALRPHLLGGTSAAWLADLLSSADCSIGATAIKDYRRRLRQAGVTL